jgi:hypothetical protein
MEEMLVIQEVVIQVVQVVQGINLVQVYQVLIELFYQVLALWVQEETQVRVAKFQTQGQLDI